MSFGYYNFDFDIMAILILVLVALIFFSKKHVMNSSSVFFVLLMASTAITPIVDIPACILVDIKAPAVPVYIINSIYYLSKQVTSIFLCYYVLSQLDMIRKISPIKQTILLAPASFMVLAILTNDSTKLVFTYENNEFHSGILRNVSIAVTIFYFVWAVVYVNIKRQQYNKVLYYTLHLMCLFALVPEIIQIFFPHVMLHSLAMSLCILLLIMTMDRYSITLDPDTGLADRQFLEISAKKLIYNKIDFDTILIRVADQDVLVQNFGFENVDTIFTLIGKKIFSYVKHGNAFRINSSCFALIVDDPGFTTALMTKLYDELPTSHETEELTIQWDYQITSISFPGEVTDIERFTSYVVGFREAKIRESGIFSNEELKVRDKAREKAVANAIKRGLSKGNFRVFYQPICTAKDRKFVSAEALIRLFDPELGSISPAEFIPIAESDGSILKIGEFVLEQVCDFISRHNTEELGLEYIELNLSMVQCLQSDFVNTIQNIISTYKISPKYLCFEVTETASNYSPGVFAENMEALDKLGFSTALDDFGSGYSNLQRMVTSRFELVKFDKDITAQLTSEDHLDGVLSTLRSMFHSMGSKVVSEGVETREEYDFVTNAGCDYIQGYYFSKPIPEKEFVEFIEAHL